MSKPTLPLSQSKPKGVRYTPVSKRQDRPDAISWLLKNYPELSDAQISRLIGTTKPTINAVREKFHWNTSNIKPQNPIPLGLCGEAELEKLVNLARARAGTVDSTTSAADATQAAGPTIEKPSAGITRKSIEDDWPAPHEAPANETAETVFGATPKTATPPTTAPESIETVFGKRAPTPAPVPEPASEEPKPS